MHNALLTDLYQLTMLQAYHAEKMNQTAVFECFIRKIPDKRQFFLAVGLEQVLNYLEELQFSEAEIDYLHSLERFTPEFLDFLRFFRFKGDVYAMPEGTIFFENEPVIQVIAPLTQAQLVESRLINLFHFQTNIATKAARCRLAMPDKLLIDFGMRRSHGKEAALMAARAAYVAGFNGTATVQAAKDFNIPLVGTMAQSYIQAHEHEKQAFIKFANIFPEHTVLLIDTYDTEQAAREVVNIASELVAQGIKIKGVRLDSGDLAYHARAVRHIFDEANLKEISIFASGDLDEYKLEQLRKEAAPIDAFGIGTRLTTLEDTPALDCVYKLEMYDGIPKRKRSQNKATWPGRKQVYRYFDQQGKMQKDRVALFDEQVVNAIPLLVPVMKEGKQLIKSKSLAEIQKDASLQLKNLPTPLTLLEKKAAYTVEISETLKELAEEIDRNI